MTPVTIIVNDNVNKKQTNKKKERKKGNQSSFAGVNHSGHMKSYMEHLVNNIFTKVEYFLSTIKIQLTTTMLPSLKSYRYRKQNKK